MKTKEIWRLKEKEINGWDMIHCVVVILSIEEDNVYFQYIDDGWFCFDDPHMGCIMNRAEFLECFERDHEHDFDFWLKELKKWREKLAEDRKRYKIGWDKGGEFQV